MKRREFLRNTVVGAVGVSTAGKLAASQPMPMRTLGKSGLEVSLFCLGGFHMGKEGQQNAVKVIQRAVDLGVNFLDSAANRAFQFGPSFRWNLFDGGRVRNNIRVQDSLTEQFRSRYENTVLLAMEDVENSLVSFVQESERRDALERSVVAAREATKLVETLYRTGLTDFQNVLDTQRTQFDQEDALAASEGQVTQNLISIYRSLGGGWTPTPIP